MILDDFLLAVGITAFDIGDEKRAEAVARVESDYGLKPDPSFWNRYSTNQGVPKPMGRIVAPIGSFRVPRQLRKELVSECAKETIFSGKTAGFDDVGDFGEIIDLVTVLNGFPATFRGYQIYGHAAEPLVRFKNAPSQAIESLRRKLVHSIGRILDYGFLRGEGTGQPTGIVNGPATATVARQPMLNESMKLMRERFSSSLTDGKHLWLASDSITFWSVQDQIQDRRSVIYTNILPTLISKHCLLLVDPSHYGACVRWDLLELAAGITYDGYLVMFFRMIADGEPLCAKADDDRSSPFIGLGGLDEPSLG